MFSRIYATLGRRFAPTPPQPRFREDYLYPFLVHLTCSLSLTSVFAFPLYRATKEISELKVEMAVLKRDASTQIAMHDKEKSIKASAIKTELKTREDKGRDVEDQATLAPGLTSPEMCAALRRWGLVRALQMQIRADAEENV